MSLLTTFKLFIIASLRLWIAQCANLSPLDGQPKQLNGGEWLSEQGKQGAAKAADQLLISRTHYKGIARYDVLHSALRTPSPLLPFLAQTHTP